MKTNILTDEFYKNLYNEIINCSDLCNEDGKCYIDEVEIGDLVVSLTATFNLKVVDDSFSHAFGVEHCCHYETDGLDYISDVEVWQYSDDDEQDVTALFDHDRFMAVMK